MPAARSSSTPEPATGWRICRQRFRRPHTLLCTHYFRDHSAGASIASRQGMRILAPTGELDIFADPEQHFRERKTFITYDNIWDTFAPIEPATVEAAHDYATLDIDGLSVSVIPLPGVTPNHTGYAITLPETGQRVAFAGEAIHSPGRMARIAPLQYDYNDLGGAVNAYWSAGELRRGGLRCPDAEPGRAHPRGRGWGARRARRLSHQALRWSAARTRVAEGHQRQTASSASPIMSGWNRSRKPRPGT